MYVGKTSQEHLLYKAMTFEQDMTGTWVVVSEDGQPSWPFPAGTRIEELLRQGWQLVKSLANLHQRGETEYLTLVLRLPMSTASRKAILAWSIPDSASALAPWQSANGSDPEQQAQ
jgi:hypothetical protein